VQSQFSIASRAQKLVAAIAQGLDDESMEADKPMDDDERVLYDINNRLLVRKHEPDTLYAHHYREYMGDGDDGYWNSERLYFSGFKALCARLVDSIYHKADVLIGTPEAVRTFSIEYPEVIPEVIWVDEAFSMTEPETLIPIMAYPNAAVKMLTGDDSQGGPIVESIDAHRIKNEEKVFVAQFGEQLGRSLLERLIRVGAPVHHLTHEDDVRHAS
jgi:hypothetical protein